MFLKESNFFDKDNSVSVAAVSTYTTVLYSVWRKHTSKYMSIIPRNLNRIREKQLLEIEGRLETARSRKSSKNKKETFGLLPVPDSLGRTSPTFHVVRIYLEDNSARMANGYVAILETEANPAIQLKRT